MPIIGLFVPCFIDQFYPQVGLATLRVLKKLGLRVEFPREQTCCGQPMANSGSEDSARPCAEKFLRVFEKYDCVVAPSASCVAMVRYHYPRWLEGKPGFERLHENTFELCEYLVDVAGIRNVDGEFAHRVGLHMSCHGLRELRLASASELITKPFNKARSLIEPLRGVELVSLTRPDECCGFGGTFAVFEEAVSALMGRDRVSDHLRAGAEIIAGYDSSCLMHLEGIIKRQKAPLRIMHIAEILEGAALS
jgi:L-lactate dehydrogenase complex protein LldE